MEWLKYAPVVLKALMETIQAVEVVFGPGTGEEKKKAVLEVIESLVDGFELTNKETIMKWAGVMIDVIVTLYNLTNKF